MIYNFFTERYEDYEPGQDLSDDQAVNYLPQHGAAQNLYHLYRERGDDVKNAMLKVLQTAAGKDVDE